MSQTVTREAAIPREAPPLAHPVLAAATALSELLAEENAALSAMDIARAGQMVDRKREAAEALIAACRHGAAPASPLALDIAGRLRERAGENKILLVRAMIAQNRIMACIARAIPPTLGQSGRYGAAGTTTASRSMPAVALSARA